MTAAKQGLAAQLTPARAAAPHPAPAGSVTLPATVLWPLRELDAALDQLARHSGLADASVDGAVPRTPAFQADVSTLDDATLDRRLDDIAAGLGLEVEPMQSSYRDADRMLRSAGPALLRIVPAWEGDAPTFIALLKGGRRRVYLIGLDGTLRALPSTHVADALWQHVTTPNAPAAAQVLRRADIAPARQARVTRALMAEMLGAKVVHNGWLLRLPPGVAPWRQARHRGLLQAGGALVAAYVIQLALTIGAWWMIGRGALAGRFDWGLLAGWALLLLTVVPFQAWAELAQRRLSVGMGVWFKQRLLAGILALNPQEVRHQGAGQFLGRVLASDTVEQVGLASGFVAVLALLQLGAATLVLAAGAGGRLHAGLLLLWVAIIVALALRYRQRSRAWVAAYREMTNDLVERMVGHRTRLAQEDRRDWHEMEDLLLNRYLALQRRLDGVESKLKALAPRGWMVLGIGGLAYAIATAATPPTAAAIAISVGGILLAYQALTTVVLGFKSLVSAQLAWQEVKTLFQAAGRAGTPPTQASAQSASSAQIGPLLSARGITFRYVPGGRAVLNECALEIAPQARMLLEGPSGGGKSTLAGVLAGLRQPESGLLLLRHVDQRMLGMTAWRRHVVAVPQFHENFVLTGSLAFNLLMGRRWPPTAADLAEAAALCDDLGLGELIARMPAGLQQMVGESGWQLSHGERSRVFIARALLQNADLLILDESFAALDPANLERTLTCVLGRAPALLVIAHP
ncbi:MAG: ATP-binding cassette domain-containing protein [Caldilineaceae bacterium]|nr:ATP-binding cassette domain-containing protein [Caldilineaceae bacterium]